MSPLLEIQEEDPNQIEEEEKVPHNEDDKNVDPIQKLGNIEDVVE